MATTLGMPSAVTARVTPRTDAFLVNTFTDSDQFGPDVVATGENEFVVVWSSLGQDGGSGGLAGVFGQRWTTGGVKVGAEFQVNTFVNGSQYEPAIAAGGGRTAISWISFSQDGDAHGVFAQRYDAGMAPEGPEFQANTDAEGAQNHPDLSVGPDGSIVVTWEGGGAVPTEGLEIFAQRYSAEGVPLGNQFQVNTTTAKAQRFPKVAHDGGGNFLVTWSSGSSFDSATDPDGSGAGVFARAYDPAGVPRGQDFVVPVHTAYAQISPAVAGRPDGGFLVAWGGYGAAGVSTSSRGVFSMGLSGDGDRMQDEDTFLGFSATDADNWISASVLGNDLQLIAWDQRSDFDSPARVAARLRTAAGRTVGAEFTLAETEAGSLEHARVASYGPADFVVAWTDHGDAPADGSGTAVSARVFGAYAECGDSTQSGGISAADALVSLKAAVGTNGCKACVCDVDASGGITASDALLILRTAVGLEAALECAECA